MKKEKPEHFKTEYDRAIYDLTVLKSELERKLEHLRKMADKHDVFIVYKDKNGYEWEARSFEDLQECYGWGGLSSKRFDALANKLKEKQKYIKHSVQIPQIEKEIILLSRYIDDIGETKEKHWPLI